MTELHELEWVATRLPDPPEPDAASTDHARRALLTHIEASGPAPAPRRRRTGPAPGRRRRFSARRLVLTGGLAATALIAGVIALDPRGAPGPGPQLAATSRHHQPPARRPAGHGTATSPSAAHRLLVRLAGDVVQSSPPPGDATLVVHHNALADGESFSGYDLYEDDGSAYYGETLTELQQAMGGTSNDDTSVNGVLAAAARSANLTPAQAAANVYAAAPVPSGPAPKVSAALAALIKAKRLAAARAGHAVPPATHQQQVDNYLWMNCSDALTEGAGRPDVRAGAMLALSTLPDVHVTSTAYDGEAVVEITNTEFPGNYAETLDLDASTGVLVHMRGGPVDGPAGVEVTYQISRVTIPSLTPAG